MNINRANILVLVLFLNISLSQTLSGKWKAIYYNDSITKILYSFQEQTTIEPERGNDFEGNFYGMSDPSISFDILKKKKLKKDTEAKLVTHDENYYYWEQTFKSSLGCVKDTTYLYINIKTTDTECYTIYCLSNNEWYSKKIDIPFSGYQIPQYINLKEFMSQKDNSLRILNDSCSSVRIDKLILVVKPKESGDFSFELNNLIFYNKKLIQLKCIHPFLNKVIDNDDVNFTFGNSLSSSSENVVLCTQETYKMKHFSNYFEFISDNPEEDIEEELFTKIMHEIIEVYPFYSERELSKQKIEVKFNTLLKGFNDSICLTEFANQLADFIKTEFNDGHFFLIPPNNKKRKNVKSPIRLYEIEGKFLVAAVFDSFYVDIVPLGTEVVSINKIPITNYVDSLSNHEYGTPDRKRYAAIAKILDAKKTDSTLITIVKNNICKDVWVKYDGKNHVPENFKAKKYGFKIEDHVVYFRAGRMDGTIFLRFKNYYDEMQTCKGLIIDLRSNPGGSSSDGEYIFSCFIDKPSVYRYILPQNQFYKKECQVVKPNRKYLFSKDYPVVIIGDERTACAAEEFIDAMKQLDNCYFLSSSKTSGALQNRYGLSFPSGAFMSIDCLSPKIWSNIESRVVECSGIEPDIWVLKTKIEDLAPYNDLMLKAAKQLIINF